MYLGAAQFMFPLKDHSGSHIEWRAVEGYKFPPSVFMCAVLQQLESANLQWSDFDNKLENATQRHKHEV
ncbi:unnamed protein product [Musa acuminata subsp. malaccensis]|uniref:(wild Malaysian banana) hypothetical protein n=1 Tax=Musa acuminata subsp. malaccensis TaxID=214687 RepID=A0A804K887_MUSAM|nr:unnamed protein product [Musa acuminata subsp. malaccensis]